MARPYAMLRAGFPYVKTVGMRRLTVNFPVDVAIGRNDALYILCRNEEGVMVRMLSQEDEDLGFFSSLGTGDGQLRWPVAIVSDGEGNFFISDEACHRISKFNAEGEFLGKWGEFGSEAGQLNAPAGMAFDSDENMYVADGLNHRVQKFTKDGEFLGQWGGFGTGNGEFNMPWGVAVDEFDDVYVADWRNDRVQKFGANGEFIFKFGSTGSSDGEFNRPAGLTLDSDGDIYVADSGNDRVQLFNQEGSFVQKFVGDATLSRSARAYMLSNPMFLRLRDMASIDMQKYFRRPRSVRVDDKGRMYVPDYGSFRVQIYQKDVERLEESQIAAPLKAPSLLTA